MNIYKCLFVGDAVPESLCKSCLLSFMLQLGKQLQKHKINKRSDHSSLTAERENSIPSTWPLFWEIKLAFQVRVEWIHCGGYPRLTRQ